MALGVRVSLKDMLDSGSMACVLSAAIFPQLLEQEVLKTPTLDVVVVRRLDHQVYVTLKWRSVDIKPLYLH